MTGPAGVPAPASVPIPTGPGAVGVGGDLAGVSAAFEVTAGARRRVRENLAWALTYNAVAVPLAAAGLFNPLFAAAAMATSGLLVVGNSARPMG